MHQQDAVQALIETGRKIFNHQRATPPEDPVRRRRRIDQAIDTLATCPALSLSEKYRGISALKRAKDRLESAGG